MFAWPGLLAAEQQQPSSTNRNVHQQLDHQSPSSTAMVIEDWTTPATTKDRPAPPLTAASQSTTTVAGSNSPTAPTVSATTSTIELSDFPTLDDFAACARSSRLFWQFEIVADDHLARSDEQQLDDFSPVLPRIQLLFDAIPVLGCATVDNGPRIQLLDPKRRDQSHWPNHKPASGTAPTGTANDNRNGGSTIPLIPLPILHTSNPRAATAATTTSGWLPVNVCRVCVLPWPLGATH
ncbi:hypothetical protein CC1G_14568 [Coprinopsis cinerea okayama7|uniref:Uncharacterized protein n=1 Tax=Coprinopsis cinerea (strain Okayama-7 / 130 / ATCC MYA-4618 / FGSC 9003) TaxID=240176 RepID=D6RMP0_COPC7|nr:hypothetical protein CC1G_14568 [Coprinopsis cinerea okayama7\|eukprot:XP_002911136.1 hypothetical protein CC1G_14568 [Coprinopsis cinerea okayama7\